MCGARRTTGAKGRRQTLELHETQASVDAVDVHCLVQWSGVAVSLRQNECQGGRGQFSLAVISTRRQKVDGTEDGHGRRERGRSKIPLKCNLDMC